MRRGTGKALENLILPSDTVCHMSRIFGRIQEDGEVRKRLKTLVGMRSEDLGGSAFVNFESGAFNHSATLPAFVYTVFCDAAWRSPPSTAGQDLSAVLKL